MNSPIIWSVNAYLQDDNTITTTDTAAGDTIVQPATAFSTNMSVYVINFF